MDKAIFKYLLPDGREVGADPRGVQHALDVLLGDFDKATFDYWGEDKDAARKAAELLGPAACKTFGLPADTSMAFWTDLLWQYMEWLEKNVVKAANSPT
jgi:hypothetical protein